MDAVEALFASGVVGMVGDLCQVVGIVGIVWWHSVGLGVVLAVSLPLMFACTPAVQRATLAAQTDDRVAVAQANEQIPRDPADAPHHPPAGPWQAFMRAGIAGAVDRAFDAQERSTSTTPCTHPS